MKVFETSAVIGEQGELSVYGVPFRAGTRVEVTIIEALPDTDDDRGEERPLKPDAIARDKARFSQGDWNRPEDVPLLRREQGE
jgi:hypothetical protein